MGGHRLAAVLFVFYFSSRAYVFLEKFFVMIMIANIVPRSRHHRDRGEAHHYWQVLAGYLGITFLAEGYPAALPKTDALALFNQPGGSLMWVSFWVIAAGFGWAVRGQVTGVLRPRSRSRRRSSRGTRTTPTSAPRCSSGLRSGL